MSAHISAVNRTPDTAQHRGTRRNESADSVRAAQAVKELRRLLLDWRGQLVGWGA